MRADWVPLSASALVIGAIALVFGTLLNPADAGAGAADLFRVVTDDNARWIAMAVSFLLASGTMTLGLPVVLTPLHGRGRRTGIAGVGLLVVGAVGMCGIAMLMVFLRARSA